MVTSLAHSFRSPNVTVSRMTITPEMAERWLLKNRDNRVLHPMKVEAYARDMTEGRWIFNGDAIRFSQSGDLQDGQHRLLGVVKSGVSLDTLVIFNLPDAARDTLDGCITRSAADGLKFKGTPNSKLTAATARKLAIWESGVYEHGGGYVPSKTEIYQFVAEHPDLQRACLLGQQAGKHLPMVPSTFAFTYYVCDQISPFTAQEFFVQKLTEKIGLERGDPALALMRRLDSVSASGVQNGLGSHQRLSDGDTVRYIFLAWNQTRDNRVITKLIAPRGGWKGNFPTPH